MLCREQLNLTICHREAEGPILPGTTFCRLALRGDAIVEAAGMDGMDAEPRSSGESCEEAAWTSGRAASLSAGAWTLGGMDMAQGKPLFLAERPSVTVPRRGGDGLWRGRPLGGAV